VEEDIVTISPKDANSNTDKSSSPGNKNPTSPSSHDSSDGSSLSTGAIIGIVIGAVAAVALIALTAFFFFPWRHQDAGNELEPSIIKSPESHSFSEHSSKNTDGSVFTMPPITHGELSGNDTQIYQLHSESGVSAIRGRPDIYELGGSGVSQVVELSERDAEYPAALAITLPSPDVRDN
jgi:hypothetical protein